MNAPDELVTRALCWRIERTDGVAIGLTTHDRDLSVGGLIHRASPGMSPSAIERSDGLEPATMDVAGALTHDAISEADLIAGTMGRRGGQHLHDRLGGGGARR